jgi:bacteriocin-like protein
MKDFNLQGFNPNEDFHELNTEELTSVDGGSYYPSIVLSPSDRGITWGGPVEPVSRVHSRSYRGAHRIRIVTE